MASASSLLPSTSFAIPPIRKPFAVSPSRTLTLKPLHLRKPLAAAAASPPPPPPDDAADPIKEERGNLPSPPPPPPPVPSSPATASEYEGKSGGGGSSAQFRGTAGQQRQTYVANEDGPLNKGASKKEEFVFSEVDLLGLDFFEKKRYRGTPPGLAPIVNPFPDDKFPEVEIIVGDPSKFEKNPRQTVTEPVEDSKSEEISTVELEQESKVGQTSSSTTTEPEEDGTLDKGTSKKGESVFSEVDLLGLDFFEKKRYRGPPPGLAPSVNDLPDDNFPEVEIIIGDPSKFEKNPCGTVTEPVEESKSEETSAVELEEESKLGQTSPSTTIERSEPEDDDTELYKPRVSSWGVFPRPPNISKTYGGGRTIPLGGEQQSAEEKAAKDKRTRELIAAYRNRQNLSIDAKTKAECKKALEEGDELMNAGKLKQALPYYEKVMKDVDFQTELHGTAALQWSICQDSLCRSKEARLMYSKLRNHRNIEISKKANMFMFSFQAMEFMKVTSSPLARSTGYETYFDKFVEQKNYYIDREDPEDAINQLIPYLIFLVSPIFFVAFIALGKSFQL